MLRRGPVDLRRAHRLLGHVPSGATSNRSHHGTRSVRFTWRGDRDMRWLTSRACSFFRVRPRTGVRQMRVPRILATSLLCGTAFSSPSDVQHAPSPAQTALVHELRVCLNVDRAKEVPPDLVSSCPQKDVEILVGISRDDLFDGLGKPTGCHGETWSTPWDFAQCRGVLDVEERTAAARDLRGVPPHRSTSPRYRPE
jgi:hypothetical protein